MLLLFFPSPAGGKFSSSLSFQSGERKVASIFLPSSQNFRHHHPLKYKISSIFVHYFSPPSLSINFISSQIPRARRNRGEREGNFEFRNFLFLGAQLFLSPSLSFFRIELLIFPLSIENFCLEWPVSFRKSGEKKPVNVPLAHSTDHKVAPHDESPFLFARAHRSFDPRCSRFTRSSPSPPRRRET